MTTEKRLIDANELYAKLGKMSREPYYQHGGEDYYVGIADAAGAVYEAPTVDAVEVVHGRWILADDGDGDVCSVCGTDFCNVIYETGNWNYCPNCGAKMDGDGNG